MDSPLSNHHKFHVFCVSPFKSLLQLYHDLVMHCELWNFTLQWDTSDFLREIHISLGHDSFVFGDEEQEEDPVECVNHIYSIWVWVGYYQYLINSYQHLVA